MVWSLSKDDDGLESVHPLTNQGAALPAPSASVPRAVSSSAARQSPHAAPSVVVDPGSQVPEHYSAISHSDVAEPTLVLKGRKLDDMRAEVARRKAAHRRKKQNNLILWATAGGVALGLGWVAGIALSPPKSSEALEEEALSPAAPEDFKSAAEGRADSGTKAERHLAAREDGAVVAPPSIVRLEDLAHEEEPTEAPRETSDTSAPSSEGTFTLDDLPSD